MIVSVVLWVALVALVWVLLALILAVRFVCRVLAEPGPVDVKRRVLGLRVVVRRP